MNQKRALSILLAVVILSFLLPAQAEEIKFYGGNLFVGSNEAIDAFYKQHPDITLNCDYGTYHGSTSEMATALITREFQCDMYYLSTSVHNWKTLMSKGFLLDLSSSDLLMGEVERMYPQIAEQLMMDGHLYAWPDGFVFGYMQVVDEVWKEAGYTMADVPKSFPAFLDFLEAWCDRMEDDPDLHIRVMGGLQEQPEMTQDFYSSWLLQLLMKEIVMQQQYAGETLHFDDEEIVRLVERCVCIGNRVVAVESYDGMAIEGLFMETTWMGMPDSEEHIVYLRLNDTQPMLTRAYMDLLAVYPGTDKSEACIDLLECMVTNPSPWRIDQYCYPDAQPRLLLGYEERAAEYEEKIAALTEQLKQEQLAVEEREKLEDELRRCQHSQQINEEQKWYFSPETLESYKNWVDRLYFPVPSVFEETGAGSQLNKLMLQAANGLLTAEQFSQKMQQLAIMVQMEAQVEGGSNE